jgi:hypothetical protein
VGEESKIVKEEGVKEEGVKRVTEKTERMGERRD